MTARIRYAVAALLFVTACTGGGGCGGCGTLDPFPDAGRFVGDKVDHAMDVRVTDGGFAVLNANWQTILAQFLPGQQLTIPLPCTVQNVTGIGNVVIGDMGAAGCTQESCGRMDGVCDSRDVPKEVDITFNNLTLGPKAPDQIEATVDLSIATGTFYVDSVNRKHLLCLLQNPFKCGVDFDTARAAPSETVLNVQIRMVIDQRWDKLLRFEVANINGSQTCGSSGAPPKPNCLDPADLLITNAGACSVCNGANWDPVKAVIIGQLADTLKSTLQEALDAQQCQTCSGGEPACPSIPGASSICVVESGSDAGTCWDVVAQKCAPRVLGVEGRVDVAAALAALTPPEEAKLDLSLALGGSASADTGLNLAMRGNTREAMLAPCAPQLPAPTLTAAPAPNFEAEASQPFDVGFSVSRTFLDQSGYHAHQSGALCLTLTTASFPILESGLFKTLLPSLGTLQGDQNVPMAVVLHPTRAPTFRVGRGEVDPEGMLVSPLVELLIEDLELDFYAQLEERHVRLFTLTVDVDVPFALETIGCEGLQPVIGSLQSAITVKGVKNSEILAEDVGEFAKLVPAFIALAEPALATGLPQLALPAFGPFKAQVVEVKGVRAIPGTEYYEHIGLFASLVPADAMCAVAVPSLHASLARVEVPTEDEMRKSQRLPWPRVLVSAASNVAELEVQWRINGGLWSTFRRPGPTGHVEVTHPSLVTQGRHLIELRARRIGERGVSKTAPVEVVIDWAKPTLSLRADRATDRMLIEAHDAVTPTEKLQFAYRVGDGEFTDFGPARVVLLSAVEEQGGLAVRVRDEAGFVTEQSHRVAEVALRPDRANGAHGDSAAGGCNAGGGGSWIAVLALAAVVLGARRATGGRRL